MSLFHLIVFISQLDPHFVEIGVKNDFCLSASYAVIWRKVIKTRVTRYVPQLSST